MCKFPNWAHRCLVILDKFLTCLYGNLFPKCSHLKAGAISASSPCRFSTSFGRNPMLPLISMLLTVCLESSRLFATCWSYHLYGRFTCVHSLGRRLNASAFLYFCPGRWSSSKLYSARCSTHRALSPYNSFDCHNQRNDAWSVLSKTF